MPPLFFGAVGNRQWSFTTRKAQDRNGPNRSASRPKVYGSSSSGQMHRQSGIRFDQQSIQDIVVSTIQMNQRRTDARPDYGDEAKGRPSVCSDKGRNLRKRVSVGNMTLASTSSSLPEQVLGSEEEQRRGRLTRAQTMEHIVIHGAEMDTLSLGKKTRDHIFPNKDELFHTDRKQYRLINCIALLHGTSILSATIMFVIGWEADRLQWTHTVSREVCKCIISLCTLLAFACTVVVRSEQHREFKYPRLTMLLLIEYIFILLHVPPFTFWPEDGWEKGWMDTWNILVFVRSYIIYEVLRVRSPLWRLRRINFDNRGDPSKVTGFYYFKYSMSSNPLKFFGCSSVVLMVLLSGSMLIFERSYQPDMDFRHCIYYMIIVFTSVGLGDVVCITWQGRMLTIASAVTGFVFLSICVGFLFEAIEMHDVEMEIKENHLKIMAWIEYRNFAAILIQRWWRKRSKKTKQPIKAREKVHPSEENTDYLISLSFSDAKDAIHEQMMLANKQSVGHVARMTQVLVEKLTRDMEGLVLKVTRMSEKLNCKTPASDPAEKIRSGASNSVKEMINMRPHRYSCREKTSSSGLTFSALSETVNRFSNPHKRHTSDTE